MTLSDAKRNVKWRYWTKSGVSGKWRAGRPGEFTLPDRHCGKLMDSAGARRHPRMPAGSGRNECGFGGAFWQGITQGADRHSEFPADCLPGFARGLQLEKPIPAEDAAGTAAMLAGCLRLLHTRHHALDDHLPF